MSVNSPAKRWSMIQWGSLGSGPPLPEDTTISAVGRAHLLGLYSGIDLSESGVGVTEYDVFENNFSRNESISDTSVSTDLKVIGPYHLVLKGQCIRFNFSIRVHDGTSVDLAGFQLEAQFFEGGLWRIMQTTWGAAGDRGGLVIHTKDNLEALAHDTLGVAMLDPLGIWALRFKVKLASVPTEAVTRTLEIAAIR